MTAPAIPAPAPKGRLGNGQLRRQVAGWLAARPDPHTVGEIAKDLGRSAGARSPPAPAPPDPVPGGGPAPLPARPPPAGERPRAPGRGTGINAAGKKRRRPRKNRGTQVRKPE